MIGGNESCTAGPISLSYLTCVAHLLGEWTGVEHLEDYLGYTVYLLWLLLPLAIAFIFPGIFFFVFIYSAVIILYIHKRKLNGEKSGNVWDGARKLLTTLWDGHARIWHGYEVHGVEKIPEGPALFVFYHGACPADIIYFISRLLLEKKRFCYVVADHFVSRIPVYSQEDHWQCQAGGAVVAPTDRAGIQSNFTERLAETSQSSTKVNVKLRIWDEIIPCDSTGFKLIIEAFEILHGPKEACVNTLKKGCLLGISPGGVREALFSDETYVIIWGNRKGFAQVAIDAKVPIIPVFTQNVREGIRTLGKIKILRKLYERIRLPVVPMYGGFPVKLRTFVGEPIPYDPNITAEELTAKTKAALQALIEKHQKIPGSICRALMERFQTRQKED